MAMATIKISLHQDLAGWHACLWGRSSPILRPVEGNALPAHRAIFDSPEDAVAGVCALLGCATVEVEVVRTYWLRHD